MYQCAPVDWNCTPLCTFAPPRLSNCIPLIFVEYYCVLLMGLCVPICVQLFFIAHQCFPLCTCLFTIVYCSWVFVQNCVPFLATRGCCHMHLDRCTPNLQHKAVPPDVRSACSTAESPATAVDRHCSWSKIYLCTIVYFCVPMCTVVYYCVPLCTFVYYCVLLSTIVYCCVLLCTVMYH